MADISLHYSSKAPAGRHLHRVQPDPGDLAPPRPASAANFRTLDPRTLRDLGLSASDIQFEANKPFWRV